MAKFGERFEAAKIDAATAMASGLARNAAENGYVIYVAELPKQSGLIGSVDTWGIALAAIESHGWRLEHWAIDPAGNARPVFRLSPVRAA